MTLDPDICYRALLTRDARFDGRFFTAVTSTGIFCRPVCPARTPRRDNCRFYANAAAALDAGFRPCLRCRPEHAPRYDDAARSTPVARAMAMMASGELEEERLPAIAARLGMDERHLRRLFVAELGVPPSSVMRARRVLFAKQLIDQTTMPMIGVAHAAGFNSVRRFNHVMREVYGRAPRDLRRHSTHESPGNADRENDNRTEGAPETAGRIALRLPFSPPFSWSMLVGFLGPRAIPGVEDVAPAYYRRTIRLGGHHGRLEIRPAPRGNWLVAAIEFPDIVRLPAIVERLRGLFDLGANSAAIDDNLAGDPMLEPLVRRCPGLRVPGAWDPFELAVRALLGQQVSVRGATTLAGRLVRMFGTELPGSPDGAPCRLFPRAEDLAQADVAAIGLPRTRAAAIARMAREACDDPSLFDPTRGLDESLDRLRMIPGVGDWTAQYIAMRALRHPDAFPAGDLGLLHALARLGIVAEGTAGTRALRTRAEAWRPWRAYAAMHLWNSGTS